MARDPHAPIRKGAYEPLTAAEHRENMVYFKAPPERAVGDRLNKVARYDRFLDAAEREEVEKDEVADRSPPDSADESGATN